MWSDGGGKALAARRPPWPEEGNFWSGCIAAKRSGVVRDASLQIEMSMRLALVIRVGSHLN